MSDLISNSRPSLRDFTPARVSLPTTGHSIATTELLNFQLAHAQARDAVHASLHLPSLAQRLHTELPILVEASIPVLQLQTNAPNRAVYLRQPIHGRTLQFCFIRMIPPLNSGTRLMGLTRGFIRVPRDGALTVAIGDAITSSSFIET